MTMNNPSLGTGIGLPLEASGTPVFTIKDLPAHLSEVLPGNTSPRWVLDHLGCDVHQVRQLAASISDTANDIPHDGEFATSRKAHLSGLIWILRNLCASLEWKIDQIERHYTLILKENSEKSEQR